MKTMTVLSALSEHALAVLAPPRCAACDARVGVRAILCAACAATAREDEAGRDRAHAELAAFVYGGAIATALTRFKYERRADLARPIAHLLMRTTSVLATDPPDVIVPVPLYPTRLAERGYNQAALLARPIAAQLRARFAPLALLRARDTPQQAHLDRAARAENVAGAFRVREEVRGLRVLLVDDVVTTGATLRECALVLRRAGGRDVRAAVVARAE